MAERNVRGIHQHIIETIARSILRGEFRELDTLDLPGLQTSLGVSSTAMREALKVLSAKGLVGARQRRGTFVRPRSDWALLDPDVVRWQFSDGVDLDVLAHLEELRMIVEPAVARLAAERATPSDLSRISEALDAMRDAKTEAAAASADVAFHHAVFEAAHNELLLRMDVLITTGIEQRDLVVHGALAIRPAPAHARVFRALVARSAEDAETAMRRVLLTAQRDVDKLYPHRPKGSRVAGG